MTFSQLMRCLMTCRVERLGHGYEFVERARQ